MLFVFNRRPISQAGKSAFQAAKRDERPLSFDPGRRGFDPRLPLFSYQQFAAVDVHFLSSKVSLMM